MDLVKDLTKSARRHRAEEEAPPSNRTCTLHAWLGINAVANLYTAHQLLYSQWTRSARFRGGPYARRPLDEAIASLVRGTLDPLQHDWIVLDVVRKGSTLICLDNSGLC